MSDIYTQNIIFHGTKSPNKGFLSDSTLDAYEVNTLCGDNIRIYIKTNNGIIEDAKFEGDGCSISQASTSLLIEELRGMTIEQARKIDEIFINEILGVKVNPAREKCAMLSLKTLNKILNKIS